MYGNKSAHKSRKNYMQVTNIVNQIVVSVSIEVWQKNKNQLTDQVQDKTKNKFYNPAWRLMSTQIKNQIYGQLQDNNQQSFYK